MSSNPRFYKKITNATARLINSLTGFEEGSENHDSCKAFALSSFQNHRFLDVDERKIDRWIHGLCEKFIIHSKPDKAEILQMLKTSFFEMNISEMSSACNQIRYSLLSILLNLSENPVNVEYIKPLPKEKEGSKLFDWGKYLLEGEELPYPTQWAWDDTPPTSDDEELVSPDVVCGIPSSFYSSPTKSKDDNISSIQYPSSDNLISEYWKATSGAAVFNELEGIMTPSASFMDEYNIIREILWLLTGQHNLYVFRLLNGKYVPNPDIVTSHATSPSVVSALTKVAKYGNIVQNINHFVFETSRMECQTYQAFAESLLHYIKYFRTKLMELEQRLCSHEDTLLLGDVLKILTPKFHELSAIDAVLQNSVHCDTTNDVNSKKSSRLLGTIHGLILDQSDLITDSQAQRTLKDILIQIWVHSLRPYFDMIDDWMSHGSLIDPHHEFVIQRSSNCPDVESDAFWLEAFKIASDDCTKYLSWLCPVLHSIMVAGKSMEVLVSLGKIVKNNSKVSLHDMFVHNMSTVSTTLVKKTFKNTEDNFSSSCDSMLLLNFERLFQDPNTRTIPEPSVLAVDKQMPIPTVIQRSISGLIKNKSQIADQALLDIFINEYHLIFTLKCFHKFHLMEWGDVMYDFTSSLFRKMSTGEYWEDLMSLRASLQEAISDSDPEADISFITVALNRSKQTSNITHRLIHSTDIVEIFFDIKWPLNIIFTEHCRSLYNSIFGYLMQIKHSLYCLENLKFDAIRPNMNSDSKTGLQYAHRLALLRSKILRLISHWHNFVMTSVIQAEKEVFFKKLSAAESIDKVLKAHNNFLERVMTLCLLNETKQADKMIQGTLRKIFNLAVILHMKWNRGLEGISPESLKKCESEYKECSDFLGIILQNLVSRGAVPLSLESLAFCLMS